MSTTNTQSPSLDAHAPLIDPTARVGAGVRLGPRVHIGPECVIGAGCEICAGAIIVSHTTLGEGNVVHPYAVIGGDPQDRKFSPERPGRLVIGDGNVFREHVTISRSTDASPATRVGDRNYLMAYAHIGHDCVVGDDNTFANSAHLAGHVELGSKCVFGACTMVHQFCMVGDGVMFRGLTGVSQHIPPYTVVAAENTLGGLNAIGLKRNPAISDEERRQVKEVYRAIYRDRGGASMKETLAALRERGGWGAAPERFIAFIEEALATKRQCGVAGARRGGRHGGGGGVSEIG